LLMSEQRPVEQAENEWVPQTDAEKDLVRHELENVLRDPLFQGSKRYPPFLRYVVEQTIEGLGEQIKERTVGIEVFGREASYDNTQDNVVRATATETRKRLAQHYSNRDGTNEIRIALVTGSYIPKFYRQKQLPALEPPAPPPRLWIRVGLALLMVLILGVIGAVGWRMRHGPEDPIALFWRPFFDWKSPILLCMGSQQNRVLLTTPNVTDSDPAAIPQAPQSNDPHVRFSSAANLARFSLFLESRGKTFQMRDDSSTSFQDLRSGPAVLIGGNKWALRLTAPLRFSIQWDPAKQTLWISDRQNPSRRDWEGNLETGGNLSEDFALISRFADPTTGQWIVATTGLHRFGTVASLELLSSREQMQMLAEKAPRGWDQMNLQLVIATKVVQGSNGPPRILESHFWQR
jgi:hypothetical protein